MARSAFSDLPAEIQVHIAEHCENSDLFNLFLASKLIYQRCLHILYRHVNLQDNEEGLTPRAFSPVFSSLVKKQEALVRTLLTHVKYGKYVRSLKGTLYLRTTLGNLSSREDRISQEAMFAALHFLTHVQSVDLAFKNYPHRIFVRTKQISNTWLQSTTSVRLVGTMSYVMAKSILNAVNPALLKYLCLDLVQDNNIGLGQVTILPKNMGEDSRLVSPGAMSGLLTILTDRCTVLRALDLRRVVMTLSVRRPWELADEASYMEWACFIRSVQGTVEEFTFEQSYYGPQPKRQEIDERFQRLILPAIVSRNWPYLKIMELRGVYDSYDHGGKATTLTQGLRAALGEEATILVVEKAPRFEDPGESSRWN